MLKVITIHIIGSLVYPFLLVILFMEQSKRKLTHLEFTKYDTIIVWKDVNLMNKCQNQSIISYNAILALEVKVLNV
jgi:hypothetical protein